MREKIDIIKERMEHHYLVYNALTHNHSLKQERWAKIQECEEILKILKQ